MMIGLNRLNYQTIQVGYGIQMNNLIVRCFIIQNNQSRLYHTLMIEWLKQSDYKLDHYFFILDLQVALRRGLNQIEVWYIQIFKFQICIWIYQNSRCSRLLPLNCK